MLRVQVFGGEVGLPEETRLINERLSARLRDSKIEASPLATDETWCRRIFLDVLGRIPTFAELRAFSRNHDADKRKRLVADLLFGTQYAVEYSQNSAIRWANLLIGRNGGNEPNSLVSREGLESYLHQAFLQNLPYDRLAYDLITAEGDTTPDAANFNGATNYLVMKLENDAIQATSATAQLFLGKQIQCTQCHNHPFNEWKQEQFWQLNSFFRQAVALRRYFPESQELSHVELTDQDFPGEGNPPTYDEAEVYFEPRNAVLKAVYPVFPDGPALENRSGLLSDVRRRRELAKLVVEADELALSAVNRIWSQFLGYGFTRPVDDMGPHNPASHPELLKHLADRFRLSGYDIKELTKWILLSDAYARSSSLTKYNQSDDPEMGSTPQFSRFYIRQMQAEELYESLRVLTDGNPVARDSEGEQQRRRDWLSQFTQSLGNDEGTESTTYDGSVTQALLMFNGDLVNQVISEDSNTLLQQLLIQNLAFEKKVDYLFLAALARSATREERWAAKQLVASDPNSLANVLEDLWWAILNSNEFIMNH